MWYKYQIEKATTTAHLIHQPKQAAFFDFLAGNLRAGPRDNSQTFTVLHQQSYGFWIRNFHAIAAVVGVLLFLGVVVVPALHGLVAQPPCFHHTVAQSSVVPHYRVGRQIGAGVDDAALSAHLTECKGGGRSRRLMVRFIGKARREMVSRGS